MIGHRLTISSLVIALCVPVIVHAACPAGGPLQAMQQQIDQLTRQYDELASRLSRPRIALALACVDSFSAKIQLNVSADRDLAYFAAQAQGGNPPLNIVTFVEPGVTSAAYEFNIDPSGSLRRFLIVAADTDGNTASSVMQVAPGACNPPCQPGVVCSP